MRPDRYDLIVIGAGPAGQSAAEFAAWSGKRAVIVEKAHAGGVVATTGGAPTKTLRETALELTGLGRNLANLPGAHDAAVSLDLVRPVLRDRTLDVRTRLQAIVAAQIESRGIDLVRGSARLLPGCRVEVMGPDGSRRELAGESILIATGSSPAHLPGVPFEDPDIYDSDEVYALTRIPTDVAIVGGGAVGIEFATVLATLGIPVTLVHPSRRLLPGMDGELVDRLVAELEGLGVKYALGSTVEAITRTGARLILPLSNGTAIDADAVLFAAGRTANIDGLGLEGAGVRLTDRGLIAVDAFYRTSADGVYAAGDVIGPTLASVAMQQGRAAASHAFGLVLGMTVDRAPSSAVYGLPEIASVGATEEQLRTSGVRYVVGRADLATTARGVIAGRGGLLKLIVRADDRKLLGVHCLGDIASELVGMGHAVLHMGGPVDVFLTLALNTPTYGSAYRDAAIDVMRELTALSGRRPSVPQMTGAQR